MNSKELAAGLGIGLMFGLIAGQAAQHRSARIVGIAANEHYIFRAFEDGRVERAITATTAELNQQQAIAAWIKTGVAEKDKKHFESMQVPAAAWEPIAVSDSAAPH